MAVRHISIYSIDGLIRSLSISRKTIALAHAQNAKGPEVQIDRQNLSSLTRQRRIGSRWIRIRVRYVNPWDRHKIRRSAAKRGRPSDASAGSERAIRIEVKKVPAKINGLERIYC